MFSTTSLRIFEKVAILRRPTARSVCYEPSSSNHRLATAVAALQGEPVFPAEEHSVDGLQPSVGWKPPEEPGPEDGAHSRVEALSEVWSLAEPRLRHVMRSLPDEACSQAAADRPSPKRSADEVRHCVVVECCARQCQVEERSPLAARPAYCPVADLRHDCLLDCKARLPLWPVRLPGR